MHLEKSSKDGGNVNRSNRTTH